MSSEATWSFQEILYNGISIYSSIRVIVQENGKSLRDSKNEMKRLNTLQIERPIRI